MDNKTFNWILGIMLALIFVAVLLPIGIEQFYSVSWSSLGMDSTLVTLLTTLVPLGIIIAVVLLFLKSRSSA